MVKFARLLTADGELLLSDPRKTPWEVYPRPMLRRDSFFCLNGDWELSVEDNGTSLFCGNIRVPFPPESILSGVERVFPEGAVLRYEKRFTLPEGFLNKRVILHFGAVDQFAKVMLNGTLIGRHDGGYQPFSFDITQYLQNENVLTVEVTDLLSNHVLPYGKQRRDRGGMWYTPISGIWQTVWLESTAERYITSASVETKDNTAFLRVLWNGAALDGKVTVNTPSGKLDFALNNGNATMRFDEVRNWSPDDPYLYEFTVETREERVSSYFAFRTLSIENIDGIPRMCLNGKPFFFHGLLDQGYYSDGIFTPASMNGYENDIRAMKALGFNTLRKHIKIEPQVFYYLCDRIGMVVFQDMVNNGDYSFVRDTALPTFGFLKRNDRRLHRDEKTRTAFLLHMEQTVAQLKCHPSICLWTIFNEGWGQFCGTEAYHRLRSLDDTRFVDTASGWFSGCESDLDSRHVYFRSVKLKAGAKPLFLSEFGGYVFAPECHVFNEEKSYGYGSQKTREGFVNALTSLYRDEILPLIPQGLCATVYTQVSDVEDEINGLLSYDRKIQKVSADELLPVSEALFKAINSDK